MTANPTSTNGTAAKGNATFSLIWAIAQLLRGDVKPADYGSFILPFTVLRRLDCELERTKDAVVKAAAAFTHLDNLRLDQKHAILKAAEGTFYNASPLTLTKILDDPAQLRANLEAYVGGFSPNVRDVFQRFKIEARIGELDEKDLLYKVLKELVAVDLRSTTVDNSQMGEAFEHLIRRFAELSNETAGEHYTPRDAIRLMVDLVLVGDSDLMTNKTPLRSVYDPTAGTGGMLSVAEERIQFYNDNARLTAFGQELNDESYAVCKGDMLIKGQDVENIKPGNTLSADAFADKKFDLMFSNPPYGVEWKKIQESVEDEYRKLGYKGRFGPGMPRVSDGQMLFLLHLVSKMQDLESNPNGSRVAIVMNGSPLFTGGAESGESEIRRFLFENDLIEAIVGLPTEMFYNTGLPTFVWILTNNKSPERRGLVQLIDASTFWQKMPKSLGDKRRYMSEDDIDAVVKIHGRFEKSATSKILKNEDFGYRTIVIERPLRLKFSVTTDILERLEVDKSFTKSGVDVAALIAALRSIGSEETFEDRPSFLDKLDKTLGQAGIKLKPAQYKALWQKFSTRSETAEPCRNTKNKIEADAELRDTENVPLLEDFEHYFNREVRPYADDAWFDESKSKIGYEIPYTRHFYRYEPPRALDVIDAELSNVTAELERLEASRLKALRVTEHSSSVAMKETGIAWLGAIPAHWRVLPLKYCVTISSGSTPDKDNPDFWQGGDIPWASAKDLKVETLMDTEDHITELALASGVKVVPENSVLIVVRGMILSRMFPVVLTGKPMAINQDLKALVAWKLVRAKYLALVLRSIGKAIIATADTSGHGTKVLRTEDWTKFAVPVPPLAEQDLIIARAESEGDSIATLVALAERSIELSRERRSALIASAVTGHIDPDAAVPQSRQAVAI